MILTVAGEALVPAYSRAGSPGTMKAMAKVTTATPKSTTTIHSSCRTMYPFTRVPASDGRGARAPLPRASLASRQPDVGQDQRPHRGEVGIVDARGGGARPHGR